MARQIDRVFAWAWDLAAGVARHCNIESVEIVQWPHGAGLFAPQQ